MVKDTKQKRITGQEKYLLLKFCLIGVDCNMKFNKIFRIAFEILTCQLLCIWITIYDEEHNHPASFVYMLYKAVLFYVCLKRLISFRLGNVTLR